MNKNRLEFNIRFNDQEWEILRTLKEKHAINISAVIKIFLKQKLEQLEKCGGSNGQK